MAIPSSQLRQVLEDIRRTRFMPQTRSERVALVADAIAKAVPYKNTGWLILSESGDLQDCITYPHCYPELQKIYASQMHHVPALTGFLPWRLLLSLPGVFDLGEVTMGMCYRSEFHRRCMVPVGLHASLCMSLIGESGRPYGVVALGRAPGEKFTPADHRALESLKPEVGRACASGFLEQPHTAGVTTGDEGLLMVGANGSLKHCDVVGRRLLWLAANPQLNRLRSESDPEQKILERLVRVAAGASKRVEPGLVQPYVLRIAHDRGCYDFRVHLMEPGQSDFGVVVWRSTPHLTRVARRLSGLRVGTRQKDVAVLLARGCSYPEIALELGVALSSVTTQVRALFQKFFVNSREELVQKLIGQTDIAPFPAEVGADTPGPAELH